MARQVSPMLAATGVTLAVLLGGGLFLHAQRNRAETASHAAAGANSDSADSGESDAPTATPISYTAKISCAIRFVGAENQAPLMTCLQGPGGSLKINDGRDVHEYSQVEMNDFTDSEKTVTLQPGYEILATVPYDAQTVLRVKITDSNGKQVFVDEATAGNVIVAGG